jgi:hypothetical protein
MEFHPIALVRKPLSLVSTPFPGYGRDFIVSAVVGVHFGE